MDPMNVSRWKNRWASTRSNMWDTPMARWAGEGDDWVRKMILRPPKKDDVVIGFSEADETAYAAFTEENRRHSVQRAKGVGSCARGSSWTSGATARWWWTGPMARQGKAKVGGRRRVECPKTTATGGASICGGGRTIGRCTSSVSTTKKLMLGRKRESEA